MGRYSHCVLHGLNVFMFHGEYIQTPKAMIPLCRLRFIAVLLPGTFRWGTPGLHHEPTHPQRGDAHDAEAKRSGYSQLDWRITILKGVCVCSVGKLWVLHLLMIIQHIMKLVYCVAVRPVASSGWTDPTGAMLIGCQRSPIAPQMLRTAWKCWHLVRTKQVQLNGRHINTVM